MTFTVEKFFHIFQKFYPHNHSMRQVLLFLFHKLEILSLNNVLYLRNTVQLYATAFSWRRKWQPTPIFLLGKSHGQRSLEGYIQSMSRIQLSMYTHLAFNSNDHGSLVKMHILLSFSKYFFLFSCLLLIQ